MRRVVVTGLGIVSSIGNNAEEVLTSLRQGKSGITANEAMAEHGFRSTIAGAIDLDVAEHVDKRTLRFMGPGAAYAHIAMGQAIADSGLEEADIVNPRTGLVAGSGGPSTSAMLQAHQTVCGAQDDVLDDLGQSEHRLPDQGHQLFDHLGLFDQPALHRQCRRADHDGQAGRDVRRWRRGAGLDAVVPV